MAEAGPDLDAGEGDQGGDGFLDPGDVADAGEELGDLLVGVGDPVGVGGQQGPGTDQAPGAGFVVAAAEQGEGVPQGAVGGGRVSVQGLEAGEQGEGGEQGVRRVGAGLAGPVGGLPGVGGGPGRAAAQEVADGGPVVEPGLKPGVPGGFCEALVDEAGGAGECLAGVAEQDEPGPYPVGGGRRAGQYGLRGPGGLVAQPGVAGVPGGGQQPVGPLARQRPRVRRAASSASSAATAGSPERRAVPAAAMRVRAVASSS